MRLSLPCFALSLLLAGTTAAHAAPGQAYTDPAKADADFPLQGEYVGEVQGAEGKHAWGAQVIALGDGKFHLVGYPGGLPGAGWNEKDKKEADSATVDGVPAFKVDDFVATLKEGALSVTNSAGDVLGTLNKTERQSPTVGAKPPAGAIVLFDGSSPEAFKGGRITEDGLLMEGVTSKQNFQDATYHLEFRLPYMPHARGQARGNSGFYLQGRYEVQMLDSFGLAGLDNECGGIYTVAKPRVNMCYPPLAWQTYDIDYTAAKYDAAGKKTANARVTVKHNGVVIQDNVEVPHATRASPQRESPEPGPMYLQNHGNPVRYRNIWVVEKK